MYPKDIIIKFDQYLANQNLDFEAIIVGGSALGLMGITSRQTKDCDVLFPTIPKPILDAAKNFAIHQTSEGTPLDNDWLNNGPASLIKQLPSGWKNRVRVIFQGKALTLKALGRIDQLRDKLFALCDRGIDLADCLALCPTDKELDEVVPWLEQQDGNPDWPAHVREIIADFKMRRKNGI